MPPLETVAEPEGQEVVPLEVTGETGDKVGAVEEPPLQEELVVELLEGT
ncbi:protein of unknown function [Acidithiobacillus ferrivorans]|uniref:Uncharacterized protein n=1 Tax=Acidithiobacillus ferrivorans TaxID=160808 RepID=A0A060UPL2_9PROT|nr:hypothetical protein AFERRI_400161 [Acidithiobacillus ferrivorans]SMH64409.1 protein of unknown function [Acidithiobacillus ferrivorans]